jgi:S1/P1 Nuclease
MRIPPSLWLLPLSAPLAHCWGVLGHSTVAYLAYKHLQPGTAAVLDDILANDAGYDFGDAATWADAVRHARPYSGAWHYVGEHLPPSLRHHHLLW